MTVFGGDISKVTVGDTDIYGVSVKTASDTVDPWQNFKADGNFITLSHGDLDGNGTFRISSNSLADSGGKLHLLGHIHKTSAHRLSNGKTALYGGCPAGRGFDECGERGFYVIDTDGFTFTYITTDAKIYKEYEIDISDIAEKTELIDKLRAVPVCDNEIARAVLVGALPHPIDIDTAKLQPFAPQFIEIKDKSTVNIDVMKNIDSNTLEGEFVRILSKKLEGVQQEERQVILDAVKEGVLALRGQK